MESQAEQGVDRIVYEAFFRGGRPVCSSMSARPVPTSSRSALCTRPLGGAYWRSSRTRPSLRRSEPPAARCSSTRAADYDADDVDFEIVDSHGAPYEGGAVSFESFSALRVKDSYRPLRDGELDVRRITVNVRRLETILAEHVPKLDRPDIVSIDVEGWELEALAGFSLERYRPTALIVENVFADPTYGRALRTRGYRLWRHIGPNDVYVPTGRAASSSSGRWVARS